MSAPGRRGSQNQSGFCAGRERGGDAASTVWNEGVDVVDVMDVVDGVDVVDGGLKG